MPDDRDKQEGELSGKLEELEGLVKRKTGQNRISVMGDQFIPILDELVTPDDSDVIPDKSPGEDGEKERDDDIVEKAEQKFSLELDEIVNLLKGDLKESILHELQDRIEKDPNKESGE